MLMGLNFVALDVEVADSSVPGSICQMGFAVVRDGCVVDNFSKLVFSPHPFGFWQLKNLAIGEEQVKNAPTYRRVAESVAHMMQGPIFSHTPYDRLAIRHANAACGFSFPDAVWLDSAQVVRRAWPEKYSKSGYGLKNVASDLGIAFTHHDASEDARVAAEIVIQASLEQSLDVAGWVERIRRSIPTAEGARDRSDLRRDGCVDGPLFGEVVVLTGGFDVSKPEQAELAASAGCEIANGVTKRTTMLVVGDDRHARGERSGKWTRAEELIRRGYPIRIVSESDFHRMIRD